MPHKDEPAFAAGAESWNQVGLTKREYFAAMALQGLLANPFLTETHDETIAMTCIDAADALIKALNNNQ
jgi:hypothetical protein